MESPDVIQAENLKTHYPGGDKIYPEKRTNEEMREKDKRVYWKNVEETRAKSRAYYAANQEKINALKKRCRAKPETIAKTKVYRKAQRAANLEKEKAKQKEWYAANREKILAYAKDYAARPEVAEKRKKKNALDWQQNKETRSKQYKEWHERNKEKKMQYQRDRIAKDPKAYYQHVQELKKKNINLTISEKIRSRIREVISRDGGKKALKTQVLIGCTFAELRVHLESLFLPGMTWENRGSGWHIDHKKPCALFDLTDVEQQRACFHYTNLQPLWAIDNRRKGMKYEVPVATPAAVGQG